MRAVCVCAQRVSLEPLTTSPSSSPCLKDPSVGILAVALETGFPTLGGHGKSIEVSQAEKENYELALKLVPYSKIIQSLV